MAILHKALLPLLSLTFLLQAADPPPDVEAALRSRVQEFYQLQVDKKFRQAEQLVAEDTKDFYYGMQKPDVKAFSVKRIEFAQDFRTAKVSLTLRRMVMFVGAGPQIMDMPATTTWKIDNGKWCWYVDQSKPKYTPLGTLNPTPTGRSGDTPGAPPDIAARLSGLTAMDGVHADRNSVDFDPQRPSSQIVNLKNTLPGGVTIQSLTNSPGLKIEIAKPNLGADESTQVTITPVAGNSDRPAEVVLRVGPLGQLIHIAIK